MISSLLLFLFFYFILLFFSPKSLSRLFGFGCQRSTGVFWVVYMFNTIFMVWYGSGGGGANDTIKSGIVNYHSEMEYGVRHVNVQY